jgi:hypothetical protein
VTADFLKSYRFGEGIAFLKNAFENIFIASLLQLESVVDRAIKQITQILRSRFIIINKFQIHSFSRFCGFSRPLKEISSEN